MKPTILHCAYSGLGGHSAVLFTLLRSESLRGFEHHVLFYGVEELSPDYQVQCRQLNISFRYIAKKRGIDPKSQSQVVRHLHRIKPSIVAINGTALVPLILTARLATRPRYSVVVRETQANHLKTRREWISSLLSARYADAVVYLTAEYRNEIASRLRSDVSNSQLIPNGVDTDDFAAVRRWDEPEIFQLVMVSRLVDIKDHVTLVEAIRLLVRERQWTNLHLELVGDGPTKINIERQIAAAGIASSVSCTGLLSKDQVIARMAKANIYLHCTFGETMSNSILQAMSMSLPIVASEVKGVINMLEDSKDALLVPTRDANKLADAIEKLLRSTSLRQTLGSHARERVERDFSDRKMADSYAKLFERMSE